MRQPATACTATGFGDHDYSCPPHNTPDSPRYVEDDAPCQAQSADGPPWCEHERAYEMVIFQIATHDWVRIYACTPCTATLRRRHANLGQGGTQGVARVRTAPVADPFDDYLSYVQEHFSSRLAR